jgi:hypothetical protein
MDRIENIVNTVSREIKSSVVKTALGVKEGAETDTLVDIEGVMIFVKQFFPNADLDARTLKTVVQNVFDNLLVAKIVHIIGKPVYKVTGAKKDGGVVVSTRLHQAKLA